MNRLNLMEMSKENILQKKKKETRTYISLKSFIKI